ncbi:hypothetical protein ZEAMMB73_Zm00001d044733 [Zea mays]|uniref:Uncharacterized protein n=1 Tax=Zea mays TaxID=4577 RepID=A0A1D6NR02_MAIZE|nr:hypothetical protein ZEAMMB73_Zm00001d044733 [Zea mays]
MKIPCLILLARCGNLNYCIQYCSYVNLSSSSLILDLQIFFYRLILLNITNWGLIYLNRRRKSFMR